MNIAFTICSNNYLAQAKVLIESLLKNSTNLKLYIGLCDEKNDAIDYNQFPCEIIEIKNIGIEDFDSLWEKYNIIELNTSVKASLFKYLIKQNPEANFIYYFDPDIELFNSLEYLNQEFEVHYDILLTPHILTSIPLDSKIPTENTFLNFGLYNLGFLGVRCNSLITKKFLDWWEERLLNIGYDRVCQGLFVDQLWINLIPIYFEKTKILIKKGYNFAPWNLHERINFNKNDKNEYVMDDNSKLVFYHFSNYKFSKPDVLASYYDRFTLEDSNILYNFYKIYLNKLLKNNIEEISKVECVYVAKRNILLNKKSNLEKKESLVLKIMRNITPPIIIRLFKK